jgi:hypothetical protein
MSLVTPCHNPPLIFMRFACGKFRRINPEIDQGFGLSGTFGVAGFPSSEAYKVGDSYPYARIPRMFLRQTIDLGGDTQKVEAAANQFSGSQTALERRLGRPCFCEPRLGY